MYMDMTEKVEWPGKEHFADIALCKHLKIR